MCLNNWIDPCNWCEGEITTPVHGDDEGVYYCSRLCKAMEADCVADAEQMGIESINELLTDLLIKAHGDGS